MENLKPDYKRIFNDIINKKCPQKKEQCLSILNKQSLKVYDVIKLNTIIFGRNNKKTNEFNQQLRSYDPFFIQNILAYQKRNNLSNTEISKQFNLSRNTVAKWKKLFI